MALVVRLGGKGSLPSQASRWARCFSVATPALKKEWPFYLGTKPHSPNSELVVTNKYDGTTVAKCALAKETDIDAAIAAASKATEACAEMASWQRKEVLLRCVAQFKQRFDEFAYALALEAGKPIKDARGEVTRLIDTFQIAAEETTRMYGEFQQMDISERTNGYMGIVRRFPIGPVSMVSPFNFPLNLAAHKIAPAIAVGCPWVLKPASKTPLGALLIGEVLHDHCSDLLPPGSWSILPCDRKGADKFTTDERFKLLSFTGSPEVGWDMKKRAGKKKVVLELGGNAACVVEDIPWDRLEGALQRLLFGGFYQSGQSCIHMQRLYVKDGLYEVVKNKLTALVKTLPAGNPLDEATFVGPMISEGEAQRVEKWIQEAVAGGAKVLAGGKRTGAMVEATLVEGAPESSNLWKEEVFGPVVCIKPYTDFKHVISEVNDGKYGIHVGIYTQNLNKSFYAFTKLETGGVVINDIPSMRIDSQPYGGVKDSGIGREGVRYAMEDMTELKVMILRDAESLEHESGAKH